MHGRSYAAHESGFGTRRGRGRARRSGRFFGLDVERIGPRARIAAALAMLIPVALSGLLLVAFAPGLWWIFTTYFWVAFPSLRLLTQGAAGFSGRKPQRKTFARFGGERGSSSRPCGGRGSSPRPERRWGRRCRWPRRTGSSRVWPRPGTWRRGFAAAASSTPCGRPPRRRERSKAGERAGGSS